MPPKKENETEEERDKRHKDKKIIHTLAKRRAAEINKGISYTVTPETKSMLIELHKHLKEVENKKDYDSITNVHPIKISKDGVLILEQEKDKQGNLKKNQKEKLWYYGIEIMLAIGYKNITALTDFIYRSTYIPNDMLIPLAFNNQKRAPLFLSHYMVHIVLVRVRSVTEWINKIFDVVPLAEVAMYTKEGSILAYVKRFLKPCNIKSDPQHLPVTLTDELIKRRIDLYIQQYNIAIEIDELGHVDRPVIDEVARKKLIMETLNCRWLHINPDKKDKDFDIIEAVGMLTALFLDPNITERPTIYTVIEKMLVKLDGLKSDISKVMTSNTIVSYR